jgi:hypothetical protein
VKLRTAPYPFPFGPEALVTTNRVKACPLPLAFSAGAVDYLRPSLRARHQR